MSDTGPKKEKARVIDVTVPLQCLVKDSKLILTEASKVSDPTTPPPPNDGTGSCVCLLTAYLTGVCALQTGLPGFYDPCVGEEKSLKLLYQFRGVMHQVISADSEPLRIPKQCQYAIAVSNGLTPANVYAQQLKLTSCFFLISSQD